MEKKKTFKEFAKENKEILMIVGAAAFAYLGAKAGVNEVMEKGLLKIHLQYPDGCIQECGPIKK